ncbi:MAG: biopolymer transporter ExbD [Planctomycetota bacterium]
MKFKRRPMHGARIEMIPLIDIIFLLLVVFIYAMLSMTVHKGIRIDLPQAAFSDLDQEKDYLSITIASNGTVYLDLDPVELSELTDRVRAEANVNGKLHVQIHAHKKITHGRLVQVLDSVRAGGVTSLSIMTDDDAQF